MFRNVIILIRQDDSLRISFFPEEAIAFARLLSVQARKARRDPDALIDVWGHEDKEHDHAEAQLQIVTVCGESKRRA
jgi:hypothetical protein